MSAVKIPTFEMLYKKSNLEGKLVEWQVWIEKSGSSYNVVTEYGYQDGKKTQHVKSVSKGKVNRTILEQATLEAQSKWNEKHDREGYRPLTENMDLCDIETIAPMRPMLAHTFDPASLKKTSKAYKMPFPCYLQRKLDGIRCISRLNGEDIIMESRKGTEFVYFDRIRNAIKNLLFYMPKGLHLDGELFTDALPFEVISGVVRQKKENKKTSEQDRRNMDLIEYHIYDLYLPASPNMSFETRLELLESIRRYLSLNSPIKLVQTEKANTFTDVKEKHDQYVSEGFEGIMLRDPVGIYESNKRSKFLQKYKEFMEEEFRIVGYHDGDGIDEGLVIWECELKDGRTFSVKPKGTHEYRRELYDSAEEYIGRLLTVIFQEYSADGVPRFPVGKSVRVDM